MNLNPSIELAYIFGVYLGDGCVCFSKHHNFYFSLNAIDQDFVEHTAKAIELITGKKFAVFEDRWHRNSGRKPLYKVVAYGKEFASWLRDKCEGKKKIPGWIKRADPEVQRSFVAGIMDSEGSVWDSLSKRADGTPKIQTMLAVYTGDPWLKGFCKILEDLGVKLLTRTSAMWNGSTRPVYRQNIQARSFVESGCYFTIQRKQEKLEAYAFRVLSWNPQRPYAVQQRLASPAEEMVHA